jgi:hypothetical protein
MHATCLPLLFLSTSLPNFSHQSSSGYFADPVYSFPPIDHSQLHLLVIAVFPLIDGGTEEFGMTEGIRGEWQKVDRALTPEWQCERKGEPKSEKRMANGLLTLPVIDSSEYFRVTVYYFRKW